MASLMSSIDFPALQIAYLDEGLVPPASPADISKSNVELALAKVNAENAHRMRRRFRKLLRKARAVEIKRLRKFARVNKSKRPHLRKHIMALDSSIGHGQRIPDLTQSQRRKRRRLVMQYLTAIHGDDSNF